MKQCELRRWIEKEDWLYFYKNEISVVRVSRTLHYLESACKYIKMHEAAAKLDFYRDDAMKLQQLKLRWHFLLRL